MLLYGSLAILAVMAVLPFLPEDFPVVGLPVAYAVVAGGIVGSKQITKAQISESEEYEFQSSWKVFWISTLFGLLLLVLLFVELMVLSAVGLVSLN